MSDGALGTCVSRPLRDTFCSADQPPPDRVQLPRISDGATAADVQDLRGMAVEIFQAIDRAFTTLRDRASRGRPGRLPDMCSAAARRAEWDRANPSRPRAPSPSRPSFNRYRSDSDQRQADYAPRASPPTYSPDRYSDRRYGEQLPMPQPPSAFSSPWLLVGSSRDTPRTALLPRHERDEGVYPYEHEHGARAGPSRPRDSPDAHDAWPPLFAPDNGDRYDEKRTGARSRTERGELAGEHLDTATGLVRQAIEADQARDWPEALRARRSHIGRPSDVISSMRMRSTTSRLRSRCVMRPSTS